MLPPLVAALIIFATRNGSGCIGQSIWRIPKKLKKEVADSIWRKYVLIGNRCQQKPNNVKCVGPFYISQKQLDIGLSICP
jgi:hypothetical protein